MYCICDGTRESYVLMRGTTDDYMRSPLEARLHTRQPTSMALHGDMMLIADRVSHSVHVFRSGVECPDERLQASGMQGPTGVTIDGDSCFVASAHRVHVFDLVSGQCTGSFPTLSACGARLSCDYGIAIHRGELFMVDQRGACVHVFSQEGLHLRSFGSYGDGIGQFRRPWGIASSGECVLVSEHDGKRVQAFTSSGKAVGSISPPGAGSLTGISCITNTGGESTKVAVADWDQGCVRTLTLRPWYYES